MKKPTYYNLTHPQKRIWYMEKRYAGSSMSNIAYAAKIKGPVDLESLAKTIQFTIKVQEGLRLQFSEIDTDELCNVQQYIADYEEQSLPLFDFLTGEEELRQWADEQNQQPFVLLDSPLFYFALFRVGAEGDGGFYLKMHHLISDGWTMPWLVNFIIGIYGELCQGKKIEELENSVLSSYLEYIEGEKDYLQSGKFQKDQAFWLEEFATVVPETNLAFRENFPEDITCQRLTLTLSHEVYEAVDSYCTSQQITVFQLFYTALHTYIGRVTGNYDGVIGIAHHGRKNARQREMPGMFVSTLPIRISCHGQDTFMGLQQLVGQKLRTSARHQQYPYDKLAQCLHERGQSVSGLLNINLVQIPQWRTMLTNSTEKTSVELLPCRGDMDATPLTIYLVPDSLEGQKILKVEISYQTALFSEQEIETLYEHLLTLLVDGIQTPTKTLTELAIMSDREQQQIVVDFNNTQLPYPKDQTIVDLFLAQVLAHPEQQALVWNDQSLTYAQLNKKSNQLATILCEAGIQADDMVGILANRSLEMLVAVLAVIKAGGAYVPIDSAYPDERIEYMLADSQAKIVLSQQSLRSRVNQFAGTWLDIEDPLLYQGDGADFPSIPAPNHLVYMIYTSGSTGKPKGVMIEHQALVNLCTWQNSYHHVTAADHTAFYSGFGFDASVWEIFPFLTVGATVHIISDELRLSPLALNDYFEKHHITIADLPTQFAEQFMELTANQSLRRLVTGGDKLKQCRLGRYELINEYGPTEYTISATAYVVEKMQHNIPIGKPLANTQIYVLDQQNRPLPIGIPGEMYIAGAGLARGYFNQPELTKEKFIPNPFIAGTRMYRTGDVVRWLPDGNLEFIGRADFQVKIRGFRIELGEIEQHLIEHPRIEQVVVIDVTDQSGGKFLCAYVVSREEFTVSEMQEFLGDRLPDYMIPTYVITLVDLPLTANGKVDRRALPLPSLENTQSLAYVAPRNEVEVSLVAIWQEILLMDHIGIEDNFFSLGGHSLKAGILQYKIQKNLHVRVTLPLIFQYPTIRQLAEYIGGKQQEMERAIPPAPIKEYYPLSMGQQRIFAVSHMEGIGASYNITSVNVLEGEIDIARLEKAINQLIDRHEMLRTSFHEMDGIPVQKIIPPGAWGRVAIENINVTARQTGEQEDINQIVGNFVRPFDLSVAPLLRVGIGELSLQRYVLIIDIHHIVFDGLSQAILLAELSALYTGQSLPQLKTQYRDYAVWQGGESNNEQLKKQEKYWLDTFAGEVPVLNLPLDYPRPGMQSFSGKRIYFKIEAALLREIEALSTCQGATLYMVLLAAFQTLLARYSRQEDIIVGSPAAGRTHGDLDQMVGMFVNTLPIRCQPTLQKTFAEFLREVKEQALGAMEHQDYQFNTLVNKLGVQRDVSRNPLFDVMFVLQNAGEVALALPGVSTSNIPFELDSAQFDLTLELEKEGHELVGAMEYCDQLFHHSTIQRMITHFQNILWAVVKEPKQQLGNIPLLSQEEQQQLLVEFNNTKLSCQGAVTVHGMFEKIVAQDPNQTALVWHDHCYSYQQLHERTNQLAHTLRKQGVTAGSIVGILVNRNPNIIIASLAIMKAGGAYLPIDPSYPEERIGYMLADSGAAHLLTEKELVGKVADYAGLCMDLQEEKWFDTNRDTLASSSGFKDLAYVIYTSGSTGKPKGVLIEHGNLINLCIWHHHYHQVTKDDHGATYSGFGFDASIWEMYPFLTIGACLHIIPEELRLSPIEINDYFEKHQITITNFPTQFCEQFMEQTDNQSLKTLVTGGDKLKTYQQRRYRLVNEYGPTEYTISATAFCVDQRYDNIPIGKPLANTWVYILDAYGNLQPIGVPGELCIAGGQLARGYLNRPELTAEKFVANPFQTEELNAKMYKTGDLVRWLPDGNIEFLGRIDQQVKIRGYRIELGEIEQRLLAYDKVQDTVVFDRKDHSGNSYLCAYFVSSQLVTIEELKSFLGQELPDYMVPAYFIQVATIPLTANGKVDKRALPVPDITATQEKISYVAPRNDIEKALVTVWQEVLGIERIGIHDIFFALGGDSIKAIQVIGRLGKQQLKLEMKHIFQHPTIGELSNYVVKVVRGVDNRLIEGEVQLTPIQHWFFTADFTNKHHWNQSLLLKNETGIDVQAFTTALTAIVTHHDALRMVYQVANGKVIQYNRGITGKEPLFELEVVQLHEKGTPLRQQLEVQANALQESMELSKGPLLHGAICKSEEGDYVILVAHHLVIDNISWQIIQEDLTTAYTQVCGGKEIQLPAKTNSYQLWSQKLQEYAVSRKLLGQCEYWRKLEQSNIVALPVDQVVSGPKKLCDNDLATISFTEEETAEVLNTAHHSYHTEASDLLLTSLGLAIHEWTGQEKVLVTLEGHGREEIMPDMDISRTVGWFTSTYPVVMDMEKYHDLGYTLKSVKETIRRIPNRGMGSDILRYLTPSVNRNFDYLLKPEIEFNYSGEVDNTEQGDEVFSTVDVTVGQDFSSATEMDFKLLVSAMIMKGKLTITIEYSNLEYKTTTMEKLLKLYQQQLGKILHHCKNAIGEATPSDLGDLNLNLEELSSIYEVCGRKITSIYPLTPMQEGMLFLARRHQESNAYFEQEVVAIKGKINISLFEENLNDVIARHEILRTAFVFEKLNRPRQVVLQERPVSLYFEDISDWEEKNQQDYLEKLQRADRQKGFDLTLDPLLRLSMLKIAEEQYNLICSFPHIILDGWCMEKFTSELFDGYLLKVQNRPIPFKKTPPFKKYVDWIEEQDKDVALQIWQQYLEGLEQQTHLPMKKATGEASQYQPEDVVLRLNQQMTNQLIELAKQQKVTLNIVLQGVWGLLLQRYNNTTDVVFGTVVSGRPPSIPDVDQIMGLFINTIPVRVTASPETSFVQLIEKLQASALTVAPYTYCSLADIQACSPLKDGLISNLVAFQNIPSGEEKEGEDFSVKSIGGFDQTNYDFGVVIFPDEEIMVRFSYNGAVFTENIVKNMALHFEQVVQQIITNSQIQLQDIELLAASERQLVVQDFNATALPLPVGQTVYELFESMVAQHPQKVALVWQGISLTYEELNARANRLAWTIRAAGIGTDDIVAILVNRNVNIIIGSLAVMKAGGAYLPIDPSYPAERIAYMLEDSGARVLLTEESLRKKVTTYAGRSFDLMDEQNFAADSSNLEPISGANDLVYVIYTSGSTGKPKGVMIEHRNLVNLCIWHHHYHQVTKDDIGATYSGFGFDASIWEMYPILTIGACLHIIPEEIRLSPVAVNTYFEENQVSITNLPTQFCEQFMEETNNQSLKTLVTGGDKLKVYRQQGYRLVNEYGPTEYTISATAFCVDRVYDNIPIGKPLANTWVYILNPSGKLQPVGVPGELCIAGAQLARGYLNRPELTAEKFVDNPYQTESLNAKMYKTGDLVRWLPDGTIEFLGRLDQQVKIRGYRIELGEIEQCLVTYEGVRDAVVLDHKDGSGNSYLCAYIVANPNVTIANLKSFLGKELPDYMVPAYMIEVEEIPLTANGKVDRKALPAPNSALDRTVSYMAPRNEIEQTLVDIWQEVLGVSRIGIQDNFFELGGHSLRISSLATKIQQAFEMVLSFADLFQLKTIQEQSLLISQKQRTADQNLSIVSVPDQDYYPLSPAQKRMFVLEQMEGIGSSYHITTVLQLEGPLDMKRLSLAIEEMVNRHEALRTSFVIVENEPMQQVHSQIKYKRVLRELAEDSDEEEIKEIVKNFVKKFDLTRAPLFRIELLESSRTKHLLLFDIHHIIFDGVSMEIFWQELFALYHGEILLPPPLQYRDVAIWQNQRVASVAMRRQEEFWLQVFEGTTPILNLPTDYPRPAVRSYEGDIVEMILPPAVATAIHGIVQETQTTLFMFFLAAYYIFLGKYANQEDLVVGIPAAGRYHGDLEKVLGMFVSTLPLRAYPAANKTFHAFLSEVATHTVEALDHQEYPLEQLVEKLNLPRDSSRNPLFDVMFSFNHHESLQQAGDLKITPWDSGERAAQFDLTLEVTEDGEQLQITFEYCAALFAPATIARMAEHFQQLLVEITTNSNVQLGELSLLTAREEEQILVDFNQTTLPYPEDKTIQELFTLQAERYPHAIALVYQDQQWTYKKLDEVTNQLARTLRHKGVKPDSIVAIMVGRSADIIIGTLAVLKAGGAYLPIDPEYPLERIAYMLADSGATLLLSQSALRDKVQDFSGQWLDMGDSGLYDQQKQALEIVNSPSDLAYVIYTSGSTGKPKGVLIEHRNLVNLCTWQQQFHQVSAADHAATYSGFGFDASIWEMYPFLTIGATLHIIPEELRLSPLELNAYFERHKITITNLPTQFCEQFMELVTNKSLKTLVTGGDKLKTYHLQDFRLVNEYGPTEYTISATAFVVDKQYSNIPIGKPLANTWAYIVNQYGKPQPIGIPGELCLAGAQLARGYLNQPALTAEKFVHNPFQIGAVNEKMYKTGDLVRWLPDGNIEFLGRVDQQVKIRGYRIELGEIEQQLLAYPGILEAVVLDLPDLQGEKYLVAYVTMQDSQVQLEDTSLKNHLRQVLPEYMLPTFFIQIPLIPTTANGKIDRRRLPVPELITTDNTTLVAPTTLIEQKIAKVWQEVLGIAEFGIHDNFFTLGGNSLKVVAVVAKLQKNFEVSVNQLFEYQTIGALASQLSMKNNNLKNKLAELKELAQTMDESTTGVELMEELAREEQEKYQRANEKYETMNLMEVTPYQQVLLTGVTGYLGIHLFVELLTVTDCHIHVLIRGEDRQQAEKRLLTKLKYYFGEQVFLKIAIEKRVTVHNGYLDQEHLGLSLDDYEKLSTTVDVIIHAAANVRHYGHYNEFWQSNVKATQELLEFAERGKEKDFNYISTVSIASGKVLDQEQVLFTEEECDVGQELDNYYLKTKLEAEKAVLAARNRINTNIFRIGNIVFHSESGIYQENIEDNAFYSLLKAFINLGVMPEQMNDAEFSYVDRVAKAIVLLFDRKALVNETYHIYNSQTVKLSEVLTHKSLGLSVQAVNFSGFIDYLYRHYDQTGCKEYINNIMLHFGWLDEESEGNQPETTFTVLADKTNGLLGQLGFQWAEVEPIRMKEMVYQALRDRIEFLGNIPFLAGLSSTQIQQLAGLAILKNYNDEQDILWEKEYSDYFHLIMDGFAEVSRNSIGGWQGTLAVAGPGSMIGEENILASGPSSITAEAIMGETTTLAFSGETLRGLICENPQLAMALLQAMNDKIRRLEKMVISMA